MNKEVIEVEIELLEDQLGTVPKSKEVYTKFIATKVDPSIAKDEAEGIKEDGTTGWTTFMEDEKGLYILNYMILGFLRDAGSTLKEAVPAAGNKKGIKQLKSKLENFVFVTPRKIRFEREGEILKVCDGVLERPLRAMTAQGPRVTLAKSDSINAGATLKFQITLIESKEITVDTIRTILEYGVLKGLGQFRNGSYGQFKVNSFKVLGTPECAITAK